MFVVRDERRSRYGEYQFEQLQQGDAALPKVSSRCNCPNCPGKKLPSSRPSIVTSKFRPYRGERRRGHFHTPRFAQERFILAAAHLHFNVQLAVRLCAAVLWRAVVLLRSSKIFAGLFISKGALKHVQPKRARWRRPSANTSRSRGACPQDSQRRGSSSRTTTPVAPGAVHFACHAGGGALPAAHIPDRLGANQLPPARAVAARARERRVDSDGANDCTSGVSAGCSLICC